MFHARKARLLVFLWLYKEQGGGAVSPGLGSIFALCKIILHNEWKCSRSAFSSSTY